MHAFEQMACAHLTSPMQSGQFPTRGAAGTGAAAAGWGDSRLRAPTMAALARSNHRLPQVHMPRMRSLHFCTCIPE